MFITILSGTVEDFVSFWFSRYADTATRHKLDRSLQLNTNLFQEIEITHRKADIKQLSRQITFPIHKQWELLGVGELGLGMAWRLSETGFAELLLMVALESLHEKCPCHQSERTDPFLAAII